MDCFYSDADIEQIRAEARAEAGASQESIDAAYARGVAAERARIRAILTGPTAEHDLRGAVSLALSGLDATPENAAAIKAAQQIAAAASWDSIIETMNGKVGVAREYK